jgi:hypothetical protein
LGEFALHVNHGQAAVLDFEHSVTPANYWNTGRLESWNNGWRETPPVPTFQYSIIPCNPSTKRSPRSGPGATGFEIRLGPSPAPLPSSGIEQDNGQSHFGFPRHESLA